MNQDIFYVAAKLTLFVPLHLVLQRRVVHDDVRPGGDSSVVVGRARLVLLPRHDAVSGNIRDVLAGLVADDNVDDVVADVKVAATTAGIVHFCRQLRECH